tara:strand:- start:1670 stop:2515 length:846 start_codon:yes stop_codon:yes gene_type:complete
MKYLLVWISLSVVLLFGLTQVTFAQDYALSSSESEKIKEWNSILVLLLQEKRFEESLLYFDKILEVDPNHTDSLLNKGSVLIALGKSDNAIAYFDRLLEIEPNNTKGLTSKAAALANIDKNLNALELYNKALSIDKDNEKIKKSVARLLSITPTISSHTSLKNDDSDPKFDIHIRVTIRNATNDLVSVIESKEGRYLPASFTDNVFDDTFEKEIVRSDGQRIEVGKHSVSFQPKNDVIGMLYIEDVMNDYAISVFEVFIPYIPVEPDDQLLAEWTISRKYV